jgi:hypothetical protein
MLIRRVGVMRPGDRWSRSPAHQLTAFRDQHLSLVAGGMVGSNKQLTRAIFGGTANSASRQCARRACLFTAGLSSPSRFGCYRQPQGLTGNDKVHGSCQARVAYHWSALGYRYPDHGPPAPHTPARPRCRIRPRRRRAGSSVDRWTRARRVAGSVRVVLAHVLQNVLTNALREHEHSPRSLSAHGLAEARS